MSALEQDAPRGFVSKAEHYKALAEIDRLKDLLACTRRHKVSRSHPLHGRVLGLRDLLPNLQPTPCLMLLDLADHGAATNDELMHLGSTDAGSVKVHMHRARKAMSEAGGPVDAIATRHRIGYAMSEEARAWLKERAPEAFQTQGASR